MIKTPLSTAIGGVGMYTKNSLIIGGGKTEPPFDPASLFKNEEHGTLLDATDLSAIYQDATALTQTTVNQPIGLILDKSKRLAIGVEKVRYTKVNMLAGVSIIDDTFVFNNVAANSGFFINNSVQTGRMYKVSLVVDELIGNLQLMLGRGAGSQVFNISESSTYNLILFSLGSIPEIRINAVLLGASCVISNFSVKQIAGNHAKQLTSSARPLLQNDIKFDGIDDALNITFPNALTNCTIFSVKHGQQAQILEAQSVAQNHVINTDFKYYGIVNRALTSAERAGLVSYLNKLGAQ